MKKFALALFAINVMTFVWLMIITPTTYPRWELGFDQVRTTIQNLEQTEEYAEMNKANLLRQVTTLETSMSSAIALYRRSDDTLSLLTLFNLLGLGILAFNIKKPIKSRLVRADQSTHPASSE